MDGPILVTGGTGTLGRPLVDRLSADGADVRVMSRRPRPAVDDRPYEWAVCDLVTGEGLESAVDGISTIVHCATTPRNDVAATRRLVDAAKQSGGRPRLLYISIVGVDRIPFFYYRAKLLSEQIIEFSGLPWTIQRATQFHDLVARMTTVQRRLPVVLAPSGLHLQPVDAAEVARRLAEQAQGEPGGRAPDMGGPVVRAFPDLARATMRAAGRLRPVVPVWLPGEAARAVRHGANLCPGQAVGTVTFDEYLAGRARAVRP